MKTIKNTRGEDMGLEIGQPGEGKPDFFELRANNLKKTGCQLFILPHCRAPQPRAFPQSLAETSLRRLFLLSEQ